MVLKHPTVEPVPPTLGVRMVRAYGAEQSPFHAGTTRSATNQYFPLAKQRERDMVGGDR